MPRAPLELTIRPEEQLPSGERWRGERRAPDRAARPGVGTSLTAAEERVATLLAARWSNREIARYLDVTEHTARRHTEGVLRKLGIHSRTKVGAVLPPLSDVVGPLRVTPKGGRR